jgi:hypothetical protein
MTVTRQAQEPKLIHYKGRNYRLFCGWMLTVDKPEHDWRGALYQEGKVLVADGPTHNPERIAPVIDFSIYFQQTRHATVAENVEAFRQDLELMLENLHRHLPLQEPEPDKLLEAAKEVSEG